MKTTRSDVVSVEPQHWARTDGGTARPGNEDAYLWLGPEETGGHGYPWLVVDGEGGDGVGDLASTLLVMTVRELYDDLIDAHRSPLAALDVAAEEAAQRLASIGGVYPSLAPARASFAAVAYFEGQVYTAVAGNAALYSSRYGTLQRIGEPDLAKTIAGQGDEDPVPGSGIGVDGPLFRRGKVFDDPEGYTFLMITDGVGSMVPDDLLAQATARLGAKDCAEALVELSRSRWGDDDATAIVVRFPGKVAEMLTSQQAFLDWAATGMTKWPERTLVLQMSAANDHGVPPHTNAVALPPIQGEPEASAEEPTATVASTMAFSPAQVKAIVSASTEGSIASASPALPSAPVSSGGTMAFSPAEMARLREMVDSAPPAPSSSPTPEQHRSTDAVAFAETQAFSTGEIDAELRQASASQSALPAAGAGRQAPQSEGSTLFFSPQQMDEVRAAAAAEASVMSPPSAAATPASAANAGTGVPPAAGVPHDPTMVFSPNTDDEAFENDAFEPEPPRRMPQIAQPSSLEDYGAQTERFGVKRSPLPWIVLLLLIVGCAVAAGLLLLR